MNIPRSIGLTVRDLRQARGFTQEDFAHHAQINRVYMGVVERGEASFTLKTLMKLAAGLDMPLWRLLKTAEERDSK